MFLLVLLGACLAALSAHADAMLVFRWSVRHDPYHAKLWAAGAVVSPCLAFAATLLIGGVSFELDAGEPFLLATETALLVSLALACLLAKLQREIFAHPHLHHPYLCLSIAVATMVGTSGGRWFLVAWTDGS